MTVEQILNDIIARLDRIEAKQSAILDAVFGGVPVKSGPFQGQTPGVAQPVDPAAVAAVLAAINLPQFGPGSGLVVTWLREGHSQAEIVAAVNKLIAKTGIADRNEAAYQISTGHASGAWKQVTNLLAGKDEPNPVSHDPATNLLDGLSAVNGPADLAGIVDEVTARAEQGITWRGTRGLDAADLEVAKIALVADPRPEWATVSDKALLRILVLTGELKAKWTGSNALQPYPMRQDIQNVTVAEWLYGQKLASR